MCKVNIISRTMNTLTGDFKTMFKRLFTERGYIKIYILNTLVREQ